MTSTQNPTTDWWRSAVTYQIYIRSFADTNGDGIGDVAGIRSKLPYLAQLGVDAIWINPWYASPQADAGYDVSDYRLIEPRFGTNDEAQAMIEEAHALGLKVLLDIVPNHTSDEHAWFEAAVAAGPGSAERDRYIFRDGKGADGSEAPNDWDSVFGGQAWTRITEADGTPGQWYLHLFDTKQPDLNWENEEVRAEFDDILRFWYDRGADGFRIDVAHGMIKAPGLPDLGDRKSQLLAAVDVQGHPHWDQRGVQDIFERWRAVGEEYSPAKIYVAEAWVGEPNNLARYVAPGRLHSAFDFQLMSDPWHARTLEATARKAIEGLATVNAPVIWVMSNHDVMRHVTRYSRDQVNRPKDPLHAVGEQENDIPLGTKRARASIMLTLSLPGALYLYQGEELGLPEVEDLPDEVREDPTFWRTKGAAIGRDGCRVPLPWTREGESFGFGDGPGWLPQPSDWSELSAEAQDGDPTSMLNLYRDALRIRRASPDLSSANAADAIWHAWGEHILAFTRGEHTTVINFGAEPFELPAGEVVLCSDAAGVQGSLGQDVAVWMRLA